MGNELDEKYLRIILTPIRICARYKPRFGIKGKGGLSLEEFQLRYQSDVFYNWFGLDNPLMYAAHKAAGGMTSVYRQIGIGCEILFRQILMDTLGLLADDVRWSYRVAAPGNRQRKLSLDGRIDLTQVRNAERAAAIENWMKSAAQTLDIAPSITESLTGAVFEVRQGYKSKDSKRQNADIANAATAYTQSYLPCVVVLSAQIDEDIAFRYKVEKWLLLTGISSTASPLVSTYAFLKDVIGYDLAGFFERNSAVLRAEVDQVLKTLLTPD